MRSTILESFDTGYHNLHLPAGLSYGLLKELLEPRHRVHAQVQRGCHFGSAGATTDHLPAGPSKFATGHPWPD